MFKVLRNTVSWKSYLQLVVALSSTDAEYMAISDAVKEALWLKNLLGCMEFLAGTGVL